MQCNQADNVHSMIEYIPGDSNTTFWNTLSSWLVTQFPLLSDSLFPNMQLFSVKKTSSPFSGKTHNRQHNGGEFQNRSWRRLQYKPRKGPKRVHLFNCDKTYNLDFVEELFCEVKDYIKKKLCFDIELPIRKNYFALSEMSEMCETTIPKLQMDLAVFVVHAHESGLKINGDSPGFGYARFYRALLEVTGKSAVQSKSWKMCRSFSLDS